MDKKNNKKNARHATDDDVSPADCPQPHVHGNPFRYCPYCSWIEPEHLDTVPIDGEEVPIDKLLDQELTKGIADEGDLAVEQPESDAEGSEAGEVGDVSDSGDDGGVGTELEPPTVEYGGPRVEASEMIDYNDLPPEGTGPRPNIPFDSPYYEATEFSDEETIMESDEGVELGSESATESAEHIPDFGISEMAVLTTTRVRELVVERLGEVETQLVRKQLRKFEIEALSATSDAEYNETMEEILGLSTIQINYIAAFKNLGE